jgi:uncharacterized protein YukE
VVAQARPVPALLPDPDELLAVAGRIRSHAAALRDASSRLRRRAVAPGWHGPAAGLYHGQLADLGAAIVRAADQLDAAAAALRRIAARLSAFLSDLRALLRDAGETALDLSRVASDLLAHPDRLGGDLSDAVRDAAALGRDVLHSARSVVENSVDDALDVVGL